MTGTRRIQLASGIGLNVALAGPDDGPPVIFLHGFPESHRTWRALVPLLSDTVRMIMPDQRGFGDSDQPQQVECYEVDRLLADLFGLADALAVERFALVGHDWGGAIAWAAAIRGDPRVTRLAIINSPHPFLFQKSLVEDRAQRSASQYIRAFREPGFEKAVETMGFERFFDKSFGGHVELSAISGEERANTIRQWQRPGALTAMLNWYRASKLVVPPAGITVQVPDRLPSPFPKIRIPVRVIWGLADKALLPVQLEGIGETGEDVELFALNDVGHFAPWEAPDAVAAALRPFLLGG